MSPLLDAIFDKNLYFLADFHTDYTPFSTSPEYAIPINLKPTTLKKDELEIDAPVRLSYRLIIQCATSNSNSAQLEIDNCSSLIKANRTDFNMPQNLTPSFHFAQVYDYGCIVGEIDNTTLNH